MEEVEILEKIVKWARNYKCLGEGFCPDWESALMYGDWLTKLNIICDRQGQWSLERLVAYVRSRLKD